MLAVASADLHAVLVVIAIVAFALAVLSGFRGAIEAAVVLALLGVLLLIFA